MQSKAATVSAYLADLPDERRTAIAAVRALILKNLDKDFEEGMQYGMIGYFVPHRVYPDGYHCDPKQPLPFAGLASQKNYMSLYLMSVYGDGAHWSDFQSAWAKTGKKLDMGKCCIRFKNLDDLALDVIADTIKRTSARTYIEHYETATRSMNRGTAKPAAKKKNAGTPAKSAQRPKGRQR